MDKFCINCKYYKRGIVEYCNHDVYSVSKWTDNVSGETHTERAMCYTMRGSDSACGPEGKFFEPKKKKFFGLF